MPSLQLILRPILGILTLLLLAATPSAAFAVIANPETVQCTGPCESCLEMSGQPPRCVKCGVDPKCLGNDPGQASDQTTMLKAHNSYRAKHGTPALTWSADLAKGAQQWASACTPKGGGFAHSPGAFNAGYGENLYWGTKATAQNAADWWYKENKQYNFNDPITSYKAGDKDPKKEVRHFTQLVWRNTKQLGCGAATCGQYQYWVCRYAPPGNFNGEKPGVLAANVPPPGGGGVANAPSTSSGGGAKPQNVPGTPTPAGGGQQARGEWSAFATDSKGNWGYGSHWANQQHAQTLALNGCGGAGIGCKVFWTTKDKCVAFAQSRQGGFWYAAGGGNNKAQASQNAIKFCQSGSAPPGSCKTTVTECR